MDKPRLKLLKQLDFVNAFETGISNHIRFNLAALE